MIEPFALWTAGLFASILAPAPEVVEATPIPVISEAHGDDAEALEAQFGPSPEERVVQCFDEDGNVTVTFGTRGQYTVDNLPASCVIR